MLLGLVQTSRKKINSADDRRAPTVFHTASSRMLQDCTPRDFGKIISVSGYATKKVLRHRGGDCRHVGAIEW